MALRISEQRRRTETDLLGPADRQRVEVIRLLGVVIRAHFVDIESHVVPLLVAHRPAREQRQDQEAVQAHRPLAAGRPASSSASHDPLLQRWTVQEGQQVWFKPDWLTWDFHGVPLISSQQMMSRSCNLHQMGERSCDKWRI